MMQNQLQELPDPIKKNLDTFDLKGTWPAAVISDFLCVFINANV